MALFQSNELHRLELPADLPGVESGDWIQISVGYTAAMRKRIGLRARQPDPLKPGEWTFDLTSWKQALLEEIIKSWSDSEPVSPDAIGQLHPLVVEYLVEQFDRLSAGRTDAEKNASGSNSNHGQELATASSPANSAISSN